MRDAGRRAHKVCRSADKHHHTRRADKGVDAQELDHAACEKADTATIIRIWAAVRSLEKLAHR